MAWNSNSVVLSLPWYLLTQSILTNCLAILNNMFNSVNTRDTRSIWNAPAKLNHTASKVRSLYRFLALLTTIYCLIVRNVTKSQWDILITVVDNKRSFNMYIYLITVSLPTVQVAFKDSLIYKNISLLHISRIQQTTMHLFLLLWILKKRQVTAQIKPIPGKYDRFHIFLTGGLVLRLHHSSTTAWTLDQWPRVQKTQLIKVFISSRKAYEAPEWCYSPYWQEIECCHSYPWPYSLIGMNGIYQNDSKQLWPSDHERGQ